MIKKIYSSIFLCSMAVLLVCQFPRVKNWKIQDLESSVQENFFGRSMLFDIYGYIQLMISPNEIQQGDSMVVRLQDGRIAIPCSKADMTYQKEETFLLSEKCKEEGVRFLYVNFPSQCGSDAELLSEGVYSSADENADELISYLEENNVDILDMRAILQDYHAEDIFYYTDHHWTTYAGLISAQSIIHYLNNDETEFDEQLLEFNNFSLKKYNECWIGETGKYVSHTWANKRDSFTLIEPQFATNLQYRIPNHNIDKTGDFSCLINKEIYNQHEIGYDSSSWHYSYLFSNYDYAELINNNLADGKKILLIKDSFSMVVAPFLIIPSGRIIMWDTRYNTDSVTEYIDNHEIDIVIVAYTQGSSISKPSMFQFN